MSDIITLEIQFPEPTVSAIQGSYAQTKEQIGLGNVDNTADAAKPVSSAMQTALDEKASAAALTAHAGNTSNPHAVSKSQIGLGNVDNTADAAKPVSSAMQTALDSKASAAALTAHTSNTSNPHAVSKAQIGLGNVDNTADAAKPVSSAMQTALDAKQSASVALSILSAGFQSPVQTGVPHWNGTAWTDASAANLRQVAGLNNVNNTADAAKPVSSAMQAALDAKEPLRDAATQAEAEEGTGTEAKAWTAQRIAQAIAALGASGDGVNGWTPVLAVVEDGVRRVLQLNDWTGGTGANPGNVGYYVGPNGLTAPIGNATDLRGVQGEAGTAGMNGSQGIQGETGAPGGSINELRVEYGMIQWRASGANNWQDVIALSALQGPQGAAGEVTSAAMATAISNEETARNAAIAAGTSNISNSVATLGLAVSATPSQAEVQSIADKLDELITALRRT